jgi:hypothetical protein
MRRPLVIITLLMSGCANNGIEPAALNAPIETSSIAPVDAGEAARTELRKAQQRAVDDARRPLRAFLAEKGRDCGSARLKEAATRTTETASAMAAAMRPDYQAMVAVGSAVLDVADGARTRGCSHEARVLYDFVMRNFAGLGYAALRDRATSGVRELRGKG